MLIDCRAVLDQHVMPDMWWCHAWRLYSGHLIASPCAHQPEGETPSLSSGTVNPCRSYLKHAKELGATRHKVAPPRRARLTQGPRRGLAYVAALMVAAAPILDVVSCPPSPSVKSQPLRAIRQATVMYSPSELSQLTRLRHCAPPHLCCCPGSNLLPQPVPAQLHRWWKLPCASFVIHADTTAQLPSPHVAANNRPAALPCPAAERHRCHNAFAASRNCHVSKALSALATGPSNTSAIDVRRPRWAARAVHSRADRGGARDSAAGTPRVARQGAAVWEAHQALVWRKCAL